MNVGNFFPQHLYSKCVTALWSGINTEKQELKICAISIVLYGKP